MSDELNEESSAAQSSEEPELYAGKYKDVSSLESGYREASKSAKELKEELNKVTNVPEDYSIFEGLVLDDNAIAQLKEMGKSAGMNQKQFEIALNKFNESHANDLAAEQNIKDTLGEDNINVLKSYVDENFKHFEPEFKDGILNRLIRDENAREKAMTERNEKLNSQAPGVSSNSATTPAQTLNEIRAECHEAGLEALKDPRNLKAKQKLINLCREGGNERMKQAQGK